MSDQKPLICSFWAWLFFSSSNLHSAPIECDSVNIDWLIGFRIKPRVNKTNFPGIAGQVYMYCGVTSLAIIERVPRGPADSYLSAWFPSLSPFWSGKQMFDLLPLNSRFPVDSKRRTCPCYTTEKTVNCHAWEGREADLLASASLAQQRWGKHDRWVLGFTQA